MTAFNILLGLVCFVIATLWCALLGTALVQTWIVKWFKEREEYVKRMSLPDHEYERVN
jgi:hypothetical protein